jgi:hypothetical protein
MNDYISEYPVQRGFSTVSAIYDLVAGRGFIGGSYAAFMVAPMSDRRVNGRAMFAPFLPNDIDVFATSGDAARAIANDLYDCMGMTWDIETDVAYSMTPQGDEPALPVQVVKPHPDWKKFPEDILQSFDMDVCRAVLISPNTILADQNAGADLGKLLRINHPLRSLKRVLKYHARGVSFNEWELLKVFRAWDQMKPEDKQALIDAHDPQNKLGSSSYDGDPYDWYDDDDWFEGE